MISEIGANPHNFLSAPKTDIVNDDNFNKNLENNIKSNNEKYNEILNTYSKNLAITLKNKRIHKNIMFGVVTVLIVAIPIFFIIACYCIIINGNNNISEIIIKILPEFISFLTIFIVLPKIISKYLFNTKEERYMVEIIKNMQNHDISLLETNHPKSSVTIDVPDL
ncbi:MAG: hypothetical protein ACI4S3_06625 [Candidatus Gastranaerophilaceae bacterium]